MTSLLLVVLSSLLVISLSLDLPWPQVHQNSLNTNRSPFTATKNPLPCNTSYGLEYGRHVLSSTPIIGDDDILYASSNWNSTVSFYANGTFSSNFSMNGMNDFNSATFYDSILYLTNFDGNLYAYDSETGTLLWKFATDNNARIQSSVSVGSDGVLFFGADDYQLYAVNPDGTRKWTYLTLEAISQSPAVFDNKVIFGSYDANVYCLNQQTGDLVWSYKTGAPIWSSSPAIDENEETVYVASDDKYLYALDLDDGSLKWRAKTGGKLRATPSIGSNGDVYVSCTDSHIYAYTADGDKKWVYDVLEKDLYASPAIDNENKLYVGTASRNASESDFLCIDGDSGELIWKVTDYFNCTSTASIGSNGAVYFTTQRVELVTIFDADSVSECYGRSVTEPILQQNDSPTPFANTRAYRPLERTPNRK